MDRSLFAFVLCFFTILNQNEFRIATIAMFTSDLNAGVVPQMSPPLHDIERLRTTMVDFIVVEWYPEQMPPATHQFVGGSQFLYSLVRAVELCLG